MSSANQLNIEVVYARPDAQDVLHVKVEQGQTLLEAIEASGMLSLYPDLDIGGYNKLGIYSRAAKPSDEAKEGDRIEIYRPLVADPKEIRRRRAERAKEEGRADKVTGGKPSAVRKSSV